MMIFVLFLILASFSQFSQSIVTTYTHKGKQLLKNETRTLDVIQKDLTENYKNIFSSSDEFVHETDIPFFQEGDEIVIRLRYIGRFGIYLDGFSDHERILLAISFRPDEEEIVFNTFMRSRWDIEERVPTEIEPPKLLRISIKFLEYQFKVLINKQKKMFDHRSIIAAGPMRIFFMGQVSVNEVYVVEKKKQPDQIGKTKRLSSRTTTTPTTF